MTLGSEWQDNPPPQVSWSAQRQRPQKGGEDKMPAHPKRKKGRSPKTPPLPPYSLVLTPKGQTSDSLNSIAYG